MKTIALPEELHREIMQLRLKYKEKNVAELIKKFIIAYKQQKLLESSRLFREKLKKSGKSFKDLLKESRKIREEIADEWF